MYDRVMPRAKKSSAQLDREIASALANKSRRRGPAASPGGSRPRRYHATLRDEWDVARDAILEHEAARAAQIVRTIREEHGYATPTPTEFSDATRAVPDEVRERFFALVDERERPSMLHVEGVGHKLPHGYETHWYWTVRRGDKKIDSGVLSGGDISEFYATWPDRREQAAIVERMKKTLRDDWIAGGEFGSLNLSPTVYVTLRKSNSDVPIRGWRG